MLIEHHRGMATDARNTLALATALFMLGFLICKATGFRASELTITIPVGFVTFYAFGMHSLINAAYHGRQIAHTLAAAAK